MDIGLLQHVTISNLCTTCHSESRSWRLRCPFNPNPKVFRNKEKSCSKGLILCVTPSPSHPFNRSPESPCRARAR